MPTNDNGLASDGLPSDMPDAAGQAALVLVESLIHGLIQRSMLTVSDSIEIIETAIDVQADVAEAADGAGAKMWRSHAMLSSMATSLRYDIGGGLNGRPHPA